MGPLGFLSHRIVGVGGIEFVTTMNFEIFIFEMIEYNDFLSHWKRTEFV